MIEQQKKRIEDFDGELQALLNKYDFTLEVDEYRVYLLDNKIEAVPSYRTSKAVAVYSGSMEYETIERND